MARAPARPAGLERERRARQARAGVPAGREIVLSAKAVAGLAGLLDDLRRAPLGPGCAGAAPLDGRVAAWVADHLAGEPARGRTALVSAERLRRVEEWIDGHLGENLGLAVLCEVAGIDARALQKGFLRRRGQTPMAWVRDRRLATARLRLLEPAPDDTVTRIALECGLWHPGRFAVAYRQRYGETPSDTLRLAR